MPDEFEGEKIIERVIFALKTTVKILEEESDDTLRRVGYMLDQSGEEAQSHRKDNVSHA